MGRRLNLLASTALTASAALASGAAQAADLRMPVKAVPMAPPFSWTGCYAGLNAGGISTRLDHSVEVPNIAPLPVTFGASDRDVGFIGGVQAGCNYQFNPNWAIGLEGDINYADTNHDGPFRFTRGSEDLVGSASTRLRWLSTVRGRLGTTWGSTFLYVTGGLAIGKVEASVSATNRIGPIDTIYARVPFSNSSRQHDRRRYRACVQQQSVGEVRISALRSWQHRLCRQPGICGTAAVERVDQD